MDGYTNSQWYRETIVDLMNLGLSFEHARIAISVTDEHREVSYRVGHIDGYKKGCQDTLRKHHLSEK